MLLETIVLPFDTVGDQRPAFVVLHRAHRKMGKTKRDDKSMFSIIVQAVQSDSFATLKYHRRPFVYMECVDTCESGKLLQVPGCMFGSARVRVFYAARFNGFE